MSEALKEKARKDFHSTGLPETEWLTFWKGYLLALRRFGTHNGTQTRRK
jgi:hypothetical protein